MAKSFIAAGLQMQLLASPDGIEWLSSVPPDITVEQGFPDFYGTCANSAFALACGINQAATNTYLVRSTDGSLWVPETIPIGGGVAWYAVACSETLCVMMGAGFGSSAHLATSPDGITWTERTIPAFNFVPGVTGTAVIGFGVSVSSSLALVCCTDLTTHLVILTSPDGVTWTRQNAANQATNNLFFFGCYAGSPLNVAVGMQGQFDGINNQPYIETSPDGITWTARTATIPGGGYLTGVYYNGSLYVAVGFINAGGGGLILTSPDAITWTQRTCPSRPTFLTSVTYNPDLGLWCAVGQNDVPPNNAAGAVITSPDGITWTYGIDLNAVVMACSVFDVIYPSGPYTTFMYDDCCHLFISDNQGAVWRESNQAPALLPSAWADLYIPWVDGDYNSMLSCTNAHGTYYDDTIKADVVLSNGVASISLGEGRLGTWNLNSPDPLNSWITGAISKNGQIVLLAADTFSGLTSPYMLLSADGGATYQHVATELGERGWLTCCFAAGAQIMYAMSANNVISKSINGGLSWFDLPGSPIYANPNFSMNQQRIRCSANGQVIILANINFGTPDTGFIYVSRDGGATWTLVLQIPLDSPTQPDVGVDCGLSIDGVVMIASGWTLVNGVLISFDTGNSWTVATAPQMATLRPLTCNVSPDGVGFCVGYDVSGNINFADLSQDQGATWVATHFPNEGILNASYIVPAMPLPPPGPTFPIGGYIIERFDNRLWPTVENAWCVDCGFTLHRPTPAADLQIFAATRYGAGEIAGFINLIGGHGYSPGTTATIVDDNGTGPGTGAVATLTILGGSIVNMAITPGAGYINPQITFYDPANSGTGASAELVLLSAATLIASNPIFAPTDVGKVVRAGYGVATVIGFVDPQNITVEVILPFGRSRTDAPKPGLPILERAGTWTMTQPIQTLYLPALAGFRITGLADGVVIPPTLVPPDGVVTLDRPASAIIVGLAFQSQLQSVYLDAGEPTMQGRRKKIAAATARIEQSAGFKIGSNQPDGAVQNPPTLAPPWQNLTAAPTHAIPPYNALATPLFTGDVRIPVFGGYSTRGQVAVQQDKPLPLQVLAFVPEVLEGDKPAQEAPKKERGQ